MAETYTLDRDGRRPVRFQGVQLAEEDGQWTQGRDHNRYYTLTLYQHTDGRYVAHIGYHTLWQGETQHSAVFIGSTLASVITDLEDFDPTTWVQGYKSLLAHHRDNHGNHDTPYLRRQEALESDIRTRYAAQIRRLCATVDVAETL
jgi:hypothetical protein